MRTVLGGVAIAISVAFAIPSTPFAHTATSVERGGVRKQYAAVAFDYLVLFDPDSVVSAIDRIAHGRGREFTGGERFFRTLHVAIALRSSVVGGDR
jgi:hypothetical protein